ncbi:MAG: hypothetical protein ACXQTS_01630 [Candidatus Methanospirareceae archaeon]
MKRMKRMCFLSVSHELLSIKLFFSLALKIDKNIVTDVHITMEMRIIPRLRECFNDAKRKVSHIEKTCPMIRDRKNFSSSFIFKDADMERPRKRLTRMKSNQINIFYINTPL